MRYALSLFLALLSGLATAPVLADPLADADFVAAQTVFLKAAARRR